MDGVILADDADVLRIDPEREPHQHLHDGWQIDDGLPQNGVAAIAQSLDGYLWLGTQEGLVRYDGQEFVVFDKYNTEAMLESQVHALAIGNEGELWIGTEGGLLLYKRGVFQAFTEISGLPHHIITSIAVGYDDSVWVGTRGGLARFGGGGTRQVWTENDGLLSSSVRAVAVSSSGEVYVASGLDTPGGAFSGSKMGSLRPFSRGQSRSAGGSRLYGLM